MSAERPPESPDDGPRSPGSLARRHGAILVLFLLVAVVATWPLIARPSTHIPQGAHDIYQNYWNLWWWKRSLVEQHSSPYTTDMLFHPHRIPLGNHTHSPANMLWTLPLNVLFGIPVALNFAVLAGFVFAAHGTFLLARLYTRSRGPAILAGLAFAYLPQHVEQALEHLNLASYQAMPYFLWALVLGVRRGGRWWLGAGLFFALNALFSWHNGLLVLPLAAGVVIFEAWQRPRSLGAIAADLLKAAGVAAVVVAPFLWPILRDSLDGAAILKKQAVPKPIHPLFLIVPHPGHPIWGAALQGIYERFRTYPSVGFIAYVGVLPLALAATGGGTAMARWLRRRGDPGPGDETRLGARAAPHGAGLWLVLTLAFFLISFGDSWTFSLQEGPRSVPLPFHWLQHVPPFSLVRVPNRFLVPAALGLAVLAGIGAASLTRGLNEKPRRSLLVTLGALILLELAWWPFPVRELERPQWIDGLDAQPAGLAVLDIPSGHRARAADDMFLQTFHERPIASGYLSTRLHVIEDLLKQYPVLRKVFERYPPQEANEGPSLVEAVRALDVGLVVVHLNRSVDAITEKRKQARRQHDDDFYRMRLYNPEKGIPLATLNRFRSELQEAFGDPVYTMPDTVEIYRVR